MSRTPNRRTSSTTRSSARWSRAPYRRRSGPRSTRGARGGCRSGPPAARAATPSPSPSTSRPSRGCVRAPAERRRRAGAACHQAALGDEEAGWPTWNARRPCSSWEIRRGGDPSSHRDRPRQAGRRSDAGRSPRADAPPATPGTGRSRARAPAEGGARRREPSARPYRVDLGGCGAGRDRVPRRRGRRRARRCGPRGPRCIVDGPLGGRGRRSERAADRRAPGLAAESRRPCGCWSCPSRSPRRWTVAARRAVLDRTETGRASGGGLGRSRHPLAPPGVRPEAEGPSAAVRAARALHRRRACQILTGTSPAPRSSSGEPWRRPRQRRRRRAAAGATFPPHVLIDTSRAGRPPWSIEDVMDRGRATWSRRSPGARRRPSRCLLESVRLSSPGGNRLADRPISRTARAPARTGRCSLGGPAERGCAVRAPGASSARTARCRGPGRARGVCSRPSNVPTRTARRVPRRGSPTGPAAPRRRRRRSDGRRGRRIGLTFAGFASGEAKRRGAWTANRRITAAGGSARPSDRRLVVVGNR
jgi:hypothetical protein